jgi:hypothetical protein
MRTLYQHYLARRRASGVGLTPSASSAGWPSPGRLVPIQIAVELSGEVDDPGRAQVQGFVAEEVS